MLLRFKQDDMYLLCISDSHRNVTEEELDELIFNITGKNIKADAKTSEIDPWDIHTSIFFAATVITTVGK